MTSDKTATRGALNTNTRSGVFYGETHGNTIIELGTQNDAPNEVTIREPHLFFKLLLFAYEKIFGRDESTKMAESDTKHELEHHVSGLGEKGLEIKYGVAYFEDKDTHSPAVQPFIKIEGRARVSTVRKIMTAPKEKSRTDEAFLKKIK